MKIATMLYQTIRLFNDILHYKTQESKFKKKVKLERANNDEEVRENNQEFNN